MNLRENIPSTPDIPSIDHASRRKERLNEVLAENHKFAVAAYEFEKLLASTSFNSDDPVIEEKLAALPEQVRDRFEFGMINYEWNKRNSEERLLQIEEMIEKNVQYDITRTEMRAELPKMMYQSLGIYTEPKGEIKFEVREGYMIFIFSHPEDYQNAISRQPNVTPNDPIVEKSGGIFSHATYLSLFSDHYMGPVLMVRGDLVPEAVEDIVVHERQHFINHNILNLFSATEKYPEQKFVQDWAKIRKFQQIKDEVLAYMREGRYGFEMKENLNGELYRHLFQGLSPDDEKDARRIIDLTAKFLDHRGSSSHNRENQAILVYQLACVPFAKFPAWLKAIEAYYFERFQLLEQFDTDVSIFELPMENDWYARTMDGHYPVKYQQIYQAESFTDEAHRLVAELAGLRKKAQGIAFDQTLSLDNVREKIQELESHYKQTRQQFSVLFEPLKKEGILRPIATATRSYKYGEEVDEGTDDDSSYLSEIRKKILAELDSYPQEEIDKIAEFHDGKGDEKKGKAAIKNLITYINSIVHTLNDSRPCWVFIDREESMPHTFYIDVDFRVNSEENKRGIKGAEIIFEMHGSKSKF